MVQIESEKCIGCGSCVRDCFPKNLEIREKKAFVLRASCMECGHCVAVCPTNAVSIPNLDMKEVLELDKGMGILQAENYLDHLKARRSIRQFTKEAVSEEELELILEAGRYSPTGGNMQMVSYTVFQKDREAFCKQVLQTLGEKGRNIVASGVNSGWYPKMWIKMEEEYLSDGIDRLFFHAPLVLVIASPSPSAAIIAAAHMETMVYALGLGMLYSGFTAGAIQGSKKLQEMAGLKEGYRAEAVLVIGHPDVTYLRTVPRKKADILRK